MTTIRHSVRNVGSHWLHVAETGTAGAPPVLFLHGWPQSWRAWQTVMELAGRDGFHALAIDLPGIGGSSGHAGSGEKHHIATTIHELVTGLGLVDLTLVGHDAGGMVAYAYLRDRPDLARAVIMDVVIPGIDPWRQVLANPSIWHFAFHSIPDLPETMVFNREAEYFDYFFRAITAHPDRIVPAARDEYVSAYRKEGAMSAGFGWYRAFPKDAERNAAATEPVLTPLLYLRGSAEGGNLENYASGLREAGIRSVRTALIDEAGHFAPEENPDGVWQAIADFIRAT